MFSFYDGAFRAVFDDGFQQTMDSSNRSLWPAALSRARKYSCSD